MDGALAEFSSSNMFDFQCLQSAYMTKNGIKPEDVKETTTEDLDNLYSKMSKAMIASKTEKPA
jgi:hypothetical protein